MKDTHDDGKMALHTAIRSTTRGHGGQAIEYGLKVGYWPCLRAPFVQVALHRWRFELWFGRPSYKGTTAP